MRLLAPQWRAVGLITLVGISLTSATRKPYSKHEKAFFASDQTVEFVRPGLVITVKSAQIATDGTISVVYTIADPQGLALDSAGITTPGTVALSFIAAVLPKNDEDYTAYTTRTAAGKVVTTTQQAGADAGGVSTQTGAGQYQYVFKTHAPSGFDTTATHTIGIYGSRNLTVFDLGTNYASATYNFVPGGAKVTKVHDIVKTASCNTCHDQLSAHGGSRRGVELCVLCHSPQTLDPDTGNSVDLKVMVHKIHMGSSLPSVKAGKPYQIIGFQNSVHDWSNVEYPADVRRCETCHAQDLQAAQAANYLTKPTRVACGACHDDVNFTTGVNHAGGPQVSDAQCANCHIPKGEIDFDASIKGAHVVPTESAMLSGLAISLTKVTGGTAGSKPVVAFTIKNTKENAVPLTNLGALTFTMAGPTTDYGTTNFGSDVKTPGYVSESALKTASCGADGSCLYTFTHAIPADATGTFTIGVESRRNEVLLKGTTKEQSVTYGAKNQVVNFSVDGSTLAPRRAVVSTANCNQCHVALSIHGTLRNQTEYCVLCHNPANTDISVRPVAQVPADKTAPPEGINFNLLIHRIHTGENLPAKRPYIVVGFGGSHNDFSEVRYPAMAPNGTAGDRRNCSICHVNGSEENLTSAILAVTDPQGPINPIQPISSACTGCHVDLPAASHALSNTTSLGEACAVCHASGAAYAVDKVHAQY